MYYLGLTIKVSSYTTTSSSRGRVKANFELYQKVMHGFPSTEKQLGVTAPNPTDHLGGLMANGLETNLGSSILLGATRVEGSLTRKKCCNVC